MYNKYAYSLSVLKLDEEFYFPHMNLYFPHISAGYTHVTRSYPHNTSRYTHKEAGT